MTDTGRGARSSPEAFATLVAEFRALQGALARANADDAETLGLARAVAVLTTRMNRWRSPIGERAFGRRWHGTRTTQQSLIPPLQRVSGDDTTYAGTVVFDDFYRGSRATVHGGAIPLVFDEVLGQLSLAAERPLARTAYLHVSYRAVTPINTELVVRARIDRIEGRKRFLSGAIVHGEQVCCTAEALFVELLPGQP